MATVTLDRITKVYPNGFEAVHPTDLTVNDGEFMVLVGRPGVARRRFCGSSPASSGRARATC